jgi:Fic family protein
MATPRWQPAEQSDGLVRKALELLGGKAKSQGALVKKVAALGGFSGSTAHRHITKAVETGAIAEVPKGKARAYQLKRK